MVGGGINLVWGAKTGTSVKSKCAGSIVERRLTWWLIAVDVDREVDGAFCYY